MKKRVVSALVGGIIGAGILSIIIGEIQWGALIGLLIGIGISENIREEKRDVRIRGREEDDGEVETDERVDSNVRKFIVSTFSLSNFLLLIYLVVCDYVLNQDIVEVRYLILYLLLTFFISFFIGPMFIRRK